LVFGKVANALSTIGVAGALNTFVGGRFADALSAVSRRPTGDTLVVLAHAWGAFSVGFTGRAFSLIDQTLALGTLGVGCALDASMSQAPCVARAIGIRETSKTLFCIGQVADFIRITIRVGFALHANTGVGFAHDSGTIGVHQASWQTYTCIRLAGLVGIASHVLAGVGFAGPRFRKALPART
jgi:hypothetical protein